MLKIRTDNVQQNMYSIERTDLLNQHYIFICVNNVTSWMNGRTRH